MDEEKTIRGYIRWFNTAKRIFTLVLLLLTVGLIAAMIWVNEQPEAEPEPFDALYGKRGSYAYVDAIGLSDWVYKVGEDKNYTTYYLLEDAENYVYVVRIPDEKLPALSRQRTYWDGETDEEIPIRLTGTTRGMSAEVRSAFMDVFELSREEFDYYFGDRMFCVDETPKEDLFWSLVIVTVVSGTLVLVMLLAAIIYAIREKRLIDALERRGFLEKAAGDLNSLTAVSELNDRLRLGSRFLFGRGIVLAAAWDDVCWCYLSKAQATIATSCRFIICTADGKQHALNLEPKEESRIPDLMDLFARRNPQILLGFNEDNKRAWKEICRDRKV